jgi:DNA replication and repair protein RecF
MRIKRLTLKNFRNYRELDLEIPSGVVLFVGDNGQGKTNLIEAIHLCLRGSSFRVGKAETFVQQSGDELASFSMARAELTRNHLNHDLSWSTKLGKQTLEWNGKRATGVALAREFPIVLFSPESLASIKEGPDLRRQLVDDVLITHSATAVGILREFQKVLRTRNRVLRDFKKGDTPREETLRLLESLDPIFLPISAELASMRIEALKALSPDLQDAFKAVLQSDHRIEVEYLISQKAADHFDRAKILNAMHQRTLELRTAELDSGLTLVGPHRHDIRFLFAGKDSRYFCSQGQQRALILSYKMAQIMYHYRSHQIYPFLLLDDVLSELDPERRANLVKFLKGIPSQIFLTTTDLAFSLSPGFGDRNLSVFRIENGAVSSARNSSEGVRRGFDSSP